MSRDQVTVVDSKERRRYEIGADGQLAGFAEYLLEPGRTVFVHTEIDPVFAGKGLGSRLTKAAVEDVRSQGREVVARCSFVAAYLRSHPEYVGPPQPAGR